MKTEKNIFIAFLLNVFFSLFEIIGGLFTHSISIISDAIHDLGDALSIGISYFLERKSRKKPDQIYTYGYIRYSVLGAFITSTILVVGSILVIIGSISRFINPVTVNYNGMIILALIGVVVNTLAAYFTKEGDSLNQKSVNLHMLEDVLNWVIVLIGSILMRFTDISLIDSIMSLGVAIFILVNAFKAMQKVLDLFLEKSSIATDTIVAQLKPLSGITDIHHIHIWSIDGVNNYATMHIVSDSKNITKLKQAVRKELEKFHIVHVTIEIESSKDSCQETACHIEPVTEHHHH